LSSLGPDLHVIESPSQDGELSLALKRLLAPPDCDQRPVTCPQAAV
jgi:hypothetical protein